MNKLTREWVRKAEEDLALAALARPSSYPIHDGACFHCQQGAEKYLKALAQELGLRVRRTHDLLKLLGDVQPHHQLCVPYVEGLIS